MIISSAWSVTPKISLIREWDSAYYQNHHLQPFPKILKFTIEPNGKKRNIFYVATKHKNWQETQKKIRFAIEQLKPDIVFIEGIKQEDGVSPLIWENESKKNLDMEGNEDYFAYKIAKERSIPFLGSELSGRMKDHTSFERDIAFVTRLAELVDKYNTIIIIYGAGHYVQQEEALAEMFGTPVHVY
jgi:hypothetical protein